MAETPSPTQQRELQQFTATMRQGWRDALSSALNYWQGQDTVPNESVVATLEAATRSNLTDALAKPRRVLAINGPGAVGKGTFIQAVLNETGATRLLNTTTRKPRENETDGVDYHFVTEEVYKQLEANGELVTKKFREGRGWYGFQRAHLEAALQSPLCLVEESAEVVAQLVAGLDQETTGAALIYLLPPDPVFDTLLERLQKRMEDSGEQESLAAYDSTLGMRQVNEFGATYDGSIATCYLVNDTIERIVSVVRESIA